VEAVKDCNPPIEFNNETKGLLRLKMGSRFHSGKFHYVILQYRPDENGKDAILGWCCSCPVGARIVGCCVHVACLLWYLGRGRYFTDFRYPAMGMGEFVRDAGGYDDSSSSDSDD
jgi:hypothetical protein